MPVTSRRVLLVKPACRKWVDLRLRGLKLHWEPDLRICQIARHQGSVIYTVPVPENQHVIRVYAGSAKGAYWKLDDPLVDRVDNEALGFGFTPDMRENMPHKVRNRALAAGLDIKEEPGFIFVMTAKRVPDCWWARRDANLHQMREALWDLWECSMRSPTPLPC